MDTIPRARIAFDVANAPLRQPLAIDAFVLSPVNDAEAILTRLKRLEAKSEITATGTYSLPPLTTSDQAYNAFWHPSRILGLLLSFANRCHVQLIHPALEVQIEGQWVRKGWHSSLFIEGRAHAAPWYFGQGELAGFLQRNIQKFNDPTFAEGTGLRVALEFYDQALSEPNLEMQYLKTWIALEILVSNAPQNVNHIIPEHRFKKLRRTLRQSLETAVQEGRLQEVERPAMVEKLSELNRPSARRQVLVFCDHVFRKYPAQDVTTDEVQRFLQIRNAITHGGLMHPPDDEDYMMTLGYERGRLKALLERIVLALLQEYPNLTAFSWRHYLVGA